MWRARYKRGNCLATIALCVMISGNTGASTDQALPEQFVSIKEFLLDTVSESQRIGAATTYALLRDNLNAFRNLKMRVDNAHRVDEMIDELSAELDVIASNFEQAAQLRSDYAMHTEKSRSHLHNKRRQTRAAINQNEHRMRTVQAELDTARQSSTVVGSADHERNQIIVGANTSVLNSLQAQVEIWHRFERAQERLVSTLDISTAKVDFVLFVLEKNAQVYREASNTAHLRRNVRLALNDLQALGAIESSLTDLAASWREVDQIVGEIGRRQQAAQVTWQDVSETLLDVEVAKRDLFDSLNSKTGGS